MNRSPPHQPNFSSPTKHPHNHDSSANQTFRNLFLTPRPHTPGALRVARRARQHSLTSLLSLTSLPLFLLLLFSLTPHSAHAQANPTIGGGGACTGWVASDTTTEGAQLAENDGLYTCQSSAWVPETLVVGSVTQSGAVPTCGAATAGMLYYTGGTVEFCNGSSFTTFSAGASVALSNILAAGSANTIANTTYAQVWNWALGATGNTAFTFGETSASTASAKLVNISTAGGSDTVPLTITNGATLSNSTISINMTEGGLGIGGTSVLFLPDADTSSIAVGEGALTSQSSTSLNNTAIGFDAGEYISTGSANIAIGASAMASTSANNLFGQGNIAIGENALTSITGAATGSIAIGYNALTSSTIHQAGGKWNVAIGYEAMQYATSAVHNTALGSWAMEGSSATPLTGNYNVAVGDLALINIQGAAADNTALGYAALDQATTGGSNTALGFEALENNTTGSGNTAVGNSALTVATGSPNDALGYDAGQYISSGASNVALGYEAMQGISATPITGTGNTAVGNSALYTAQDAAASNTGVGYEALYSSTTGTQSTAVGDAALYSATGSPNDALGYNAGEYISSGQYNVALGYEAMLGISATPLTGGSNTAVGDYALGLVQGSAAQNTAVGYGALYTTTTSNSTAVGAEALNRQTSGGPNTALGYNAGRYVTTGSDNVAIGYNAMEGSLTHSLTVANAGNIAIGDLALQSIITTAAGNTAIGYQAGNSSNPTTTGTNNVFIGYNAGALGATDSNEIVIGATAMGRGSNSVTIGNGSITDAYFGMTTTCTNGTACGSGSTNSNAGAAGAVVLHAAGYNAFSDQRLKKDIHDSDLGLDFILKLRPVSYVLKAGKSLMNYGFIAQEVEKALDGRVTGMVTREKDEMGTYEIDYSSLISPLVKAVQQQQEEIADDKQQIVDLKQLIAAQQKEIADLKAARTPPRPHPTYE
jgi:hypothetical protein